VSDAQTATATTPAAPGKGALWGGRVASGLVAFALTMSAIMKISKAPPVIEGFTKFGFPDATIRPIGILELTCVALYLIPKTRLFGAILVTAYLGGAVVTHVRVGEPFFGPVVLGVLAWVGLTLRDPRLRDLVTKP
jgi:hypothetical protein